MSAQLAFAEPQNVTSDLRTALRGFAQSVVIVSTAEEGARFAMTATAVTPVSMDPPSMLVCVNRLAAFYEVLQAGADFWLNVLSATNEDVARACSGAVRGEARFEVGDWANDSAGVPYLRDAQANIRCRQSGCFAYGSHDVFIGQVGEVRSAVDVKPLIYADARYFRL